jgi:hypothetical protein
MAIATPVGGDMLFTAYLMSCPGREATREQTLSHLHGTDWGEQPKVEIDQSTAASRQERQEQTALSLLKRAVAEAPEQILFLEDDLEFNRHLRKNLAHWYPLRRTRPGGHFFGALYNPGIRELARHEAHAFFVADPDAVYGSQAFVLSLATARHIVSHWHEVPGMQDIKMSRLAAQVSPIYYHIPSLVQHVGLVSMWGGGQHYAGDYDAGWKAASTTEVPPSGPASTILLRLPILAKMREIEGWLEETEAEGLIAIAEQVIRAAPMDRTAAIVEVGSYCGKSTTGFGLTAVGVAPDRARVYAIDPHEGTVSTLDQGYMQMAPTLEKFKRNIDEAGVAGLVELIQCRSVDVPWNKPIDLLFIDGLHDYANVSADFGHFAPWLGVGGLVAFHDYGYHFPSVRRFVDELLGTGSYGTVLCVNSLVVLEKLW